MNILKFLFGTKNDRELKRLWPIVREIIKTAIENKQDLIVEGCYIPLDWKNDFEKEYINFIKCHCLIMSERYIKVHFDDIIGFANVIESRYDDDLTMESVLYDNLEMLRLAKENDVDYTLIDDIYEIDIQ